MVVVDHVRHGRFLRGIGVTAGREADINTGQSGECAWCHFLLR